MDATKLTERALFYAKGGTGNAEEFTAFVSEAIPSHAAKRFVADEVSSPLPTVERWVAGTAVPHPITWAAVAKAILTYVWQSQREGVA